MKKILWVIGIVGLGVQLSAQDARDMAAKVVQAMGGPEAVQKWSLLESEGAMSYFSGNMELKGNFRLVRQGRQSWRRIALSFGGQSYVMIEGYDGQNAWSERMGQVSDQPALNYETQSQHGMDLLLKKDATWTAGKEGESEGKKVISIEADVKGKKTVFWIDPVTYLVQEISYKDLFISDNEIKEELDMRVRLSDYQKVDGMIYPMKWQQFQKGRKLPELQLTKVVFSPKMTPSLFSRPKQKLDLRYWEEIMD